MAPTGHSEFPASSAYRLLACPGSFALGKALSDGTRRSTVYSAEGTLAHSVSESALYTGMDPTFVVGQTFKADGFEFTPDEDFVDAVRLYVDFVSNLMALGYVVALETRVSPMVHWSGLPDLGLDLYGTADCIAYHPTQRDLVIADLKFGKGVSVEVQDNAQFLYYGAGSLFAPVIDQMLAKNGHPPLPAGWSPSFVKTVVVQPRAFHPQGPIRSATYTPQEVIDWTRTTLYEGVKRARDDNGQTLNPGEHCRFCPALAHCPAYPEYVHETAVKAFSAVPIDEHILPLLSADTQTDTTNGTALVPVEDPTAGLLPQASISDQTLGELLDRVAVLKPYFAALEELARERDAAKPGSVPGWKLVPGRSRRVWGEEDERALIHSLRGVGLSDDEFKRVEVLTPAQVEKKVGKRRYQQLVEQFVGRKSGGANLVPDGDPRARLMTGRRSVEEAFGPPVNPNS